ncbi:hypothetical protein CYMTET_32092 [Cymbomonas tetramitiformis]|uniref:Uncharacterized protein n=1 Tax=Cymbomonas tetramitiformis TaxID=36881 RepID=A0AAE0FFZ2_9CHLO|nr:hypothetical protein CYMTET_32092 [Cymbomonas tetramitiformis]
MHLPWRGRRGGEEARTVAEGRVEESSEAGATAVACAEAEGKRATDASVTRWERPFRWVERAERKEAKDWRRWAVERGKAVAAEAREGGGEDGGGGRWEGELGRRGDSGGMCGGGGKRATDASVSRWGRPFRWVERAERKEAKDWRRWAVERGKEEEAKAREEEATEGTEEEDLDFLVEDTAEVVDEKAESTAAKAEEGTMKAKKEPEAEEVRKVHARLP